MNRCQERLKLILTFMALVSYLCAMKKIALNNQAESHLPHKKNKTRRENVWCDKYGYFIDLDACRARSLQQKHCRRCYASLIQVPLPF